MKKIIALILAAMLLFASFALAENLSAMTDEELKALILDAFEELQNRGNNYDPETVVSVLKDEAIADRISAFYIRWGLNDLDGMLEICDPAWKEEQENAKTALFAILANRTPVSFSVEAFHEETDGTRTALATALMDRHNGKEPVNYRNNVVLKKAADGQWYVDPRCLLTYEPIDGYTWDLPEPTPAETDWSEEETLLNTLLFYVPEGGEYYHLDENCRRVAEKYLPMKGIFTYWELNYDEYKDLKPCAICGAPSRDYAPTELTGFFMKIFDKTGLEKISYLRADVYVGDERRDLTYTYPKEGEDFYRFLFVPEELTEMSIRFSYGVSDLAPEDAALEMLRGAPVEEHELLTLNFIPEGGKTYCLNLEANSEGGFALTPAE